MELSNQISKTGSILVELLMALALLALILPAIIDGLITSRQGLPQQEQQQNALVLLKETSESLRVIREKSWSGISVNGTYYPQIDGDTWVLANGVQTVGDFNRRVIISDVYRDSDGNISQTGNIDPSIKKATIIVNWTQPKTSSIETISYFSRYLENAAHIETTYAQFSIGNTNGVTVNYTNNDPTDGEITLGGGGHGDWCKPSLSIYGYNLNHNASAMAVSAVEGKAFTVTGDNSSSETFHATTISNENPPIASPLFITDGKKAYSVFGDNEYAYIATDTKGKQGTIISLSSQQEVGWLDLQTSSSRGRSITVYNNLAYVSDTNNKIYIFDISTKTGTQTPIFISSNLPGLAKKIIIKNNQLYVATNSTSNQLIIIPLTDNGRSFGTMVNVSVNGQEGRDIYVKDDATRVYLATSESSSQNELFIIDINSSSSTYKQILGSYNTSGMNPTGVTLVSNNKAIIVGTGGVEYQVVDVANDNITNCSGNLGDFNFDIRGIASVIELDGDAYSYIITSDTTSEFKIIEGGPSGQVGSSGVYESAIFNVGYSTAFNRLSYQALIPSGTTLKFQVAIADPVSGSCAQAIYTYQDLNPSGAIPFNNDNLDYENPAQCFRYKILLSTTTVGSTPVVYSVTANFSP